MTTRSPFLSSHSLICLAAGAWLAVGPGAQAQSLASLQDTVFLVHGLPSPHAGDLDAGVDGTCFREDLTFGDVTGPLGVSPGVHTVTFRSPLSGPGDIPCGGPVVASAVFSVAAGENLSLVAHLDATATITATAFVNDLSAPPTGTTRILAHHLAAAPPVDVRVGVAGSGTLVDVLGFANGDQAAVNAPPGSYSVDLTPAGFPSVSLVDVDVEILPYTVLLAYGVGSILDGTIDVVYRAVEVQGPGGIYRAGTWQWSGLGGPGPFSFGFAGALPVTGDWDGDGEPEIGIYHPGSGTWFLRNDATPGAPDVTFQYGFPGTWPVIGDWDDDGTDSIGLYHPASGTWLLRNDASPGAPDLVFSYGFGGTLPVVGDWDDDGSISIGIYHPASGSWFLRNDVGPGTPDLLFQYGFGGTLPVVDDWDGDGLATIGIYHPASGRWFVRNSIGPGAPDAIYGFGSGGYPLPHVD